MTSDLEGKTVLVTGASKGLGAGIARAFGEARAHVAVGYGRDQDGAERVAADITAAGGRAICVQGDLSQGDACGAMVAETVAAFGPIRALVNSAGVFEYRSLDEITRTMSARSSRPTSRGC